MILTHDKILEEVAAGRIRIDPFDEALIGAASYDLHLDTEIRTIRKDVDVIEVRDETDYLDVTTVADLTEPYLLAPGETIHGITRERIELAPDICGWLEGRSRYARLGLMIHVSSGFVAPGVKNRQVLEISNVSGTPMRVYGGIRLCQIVFQRADGQAVYSGRFATQDSI